MNAKKLAKLVVIREGEVIGLDDCVFNGKYAFTVELISSKGEIFKIKRNVTPYNSSYLKILSTIKILRLKRIPMSI
jgi:hypothetical protein